MAHNFALPGAGQICIDKLNVWMDKQHLMSDLVQLKSTVDNMFIDYLRRLMTPGRVHSVAVKSEGAYGFDPEVWAGLPVRTTTPGSYEILKDFPMDGFARKKIAATNSELLEERGMVATLLGQE